MTRRAIRPALAALIAVGGLSAFAYTRFATPAEPAIDAPYACTTCDARQAAKKRLSDHLQSQPD